MYGGTPPEATSAELNGTPRAAVLAGAPDGIGSAPSVNAGFPGSRLLRTGSLPSAAQGARAVRSAAGVVAVLVTVTDPRGLIVP